MSPPADKRRLKAVALSGLVLPGAGQLHTGAWVRGALLIAATLALLALFIVRSLDVVFDAVSASPPELDLVRAWGTVWDVVDRHRGGLVPVVVGLLLVWVAGIADAWYAVGVAKPGLSEDTEGRSQPGGGAS